MAKKRGNGKVTTIGGLARLMQGEFTTVNKRMDTLEGGLNKRIDVFEGGLNKRMDTLEGEMQGMKGEMREMKQSSSELFAKLDDFISLYRDTKQEINILTRHVKRLEERIAQLEARR